MQNAKAHETNKQKKITLIFTLSWQTNFATCAYKQRSKSFKNLSKKSNTFAHRIILAVCFAFNSNNNKKNTKILADRFALFSSPHRICESKWLKCMVMFLLFAAMLQSEWKRAMTRMPARNQMMCMYNLSAVSFVLRLNESERASNIVRYKVRSMPFTSTMFTGVN